MAGKYRLVEQRGAGAMGVVWSAKHVALGHMVAIKFLSYLRAHHEPSEEARRRFLREARIAAQLGEASRHLVRVIDYGMVGGRTASTRALSRFHAFGEPMPFLVMELLQGEDLATTLRREGRLSLERVAAIVRQLARALQVAHAAGVVHRDLKPANVFMTHNEEGELLVKLMDFGVAKPTSRDETTRQGVLVGTPGYMSPEQVLGEPLDARADLWALAACAYRMLTGISPFGQGSVAEVAVRIIATEPAAPSSLVPALSGAVDEFFRRALAKKRDDRYATARELAVGFDQTLGAEQEPFSAPQLPIEVDSLGAIHTTGRARSDRRPPVRPSRPRTGRNLVLPLIALLLLFAGGAFAGTILGVRHTAAAKVLTPLHVQQTVLEALLLHGSTPPPNTLAAPAQSPAFGRR